MNQMPLTILIPTLNRPSILAKALRYYASTGFSGTIAIGDSSRPEGMRENQTLVREFGKDLQIDYHECPLLNDSSCLQHLIATTKTTYAVFSGDDDLLVPKGLQRCVDFLNGHPDYSAAHGVAVQFVYPALPEGEFRTGFYPQPVLEAETPGERLQALCQTYRVSLFSVHRIETWKQMYAHVTELTDRSFCEILPVCLSAVYGKIKQVDYLSLIRQHHEGRFALPDYYDWISRPSWPQNQAVFSRRLAEHLIRQEKIDEEKAQAMVKKAFGTHLSSQMTHQLQRDYGIGPLPTKAKIKYAVKQNRILERLLPLWRSWQNPNPFSLEALLSPRSAHYEDFQPAFRVLAESKPTAKTSNTKDN